MEEEAEVAFATFSVYNENKLDDHGGQDYDTVLESTEGKISNHSHQDYDTVLDSTKDKISDHSDQDYDTVLGSTKDKISDHSDQDYDTVHGDHIASHTCEVYHTVKDEQSGHPRSSVLEQCLGSSTAERRHPWAAEMLWMRPRTATCRPWAEATSRSERTRRLA